MTNTTLYTLWGGMFILCGGLGFIPGPAGFLGGMLTALSLLFFLPPAVLLWRAIRAGDRNTLALLRNLSGGSLLLTLALLVANFLSLALPEALGTALYVMLVIVSSPMVCSGYWALSLFLWACLWVAAGKAGKKIK